MGDDLTAARRFCDTVRSDMSALIDAVCTQPPAAPDVLIGSLARIQSGAKRLHARSIFRAAQTVVNSVNDSAPLPTLQGRILSLNKLITQYETGLDDVMPRPANSGDDALDIDLGRGNDSALGFSADKPPMPDIDARFRAARSALAPLMAFARPGEESEALIKLAAFSEADLADADLKTDDAALEPIDADCDILLETLFEAGPDSVADKPLQPISHTEFSQADIAEDDMRLTQDTASTAPRPIMTPRASPQIDFEMLMPDFISRALQEARQTDKTVSVSYASEGVTVARSQLPVLQNLFEHIAKTLVQSVLELPETRRLRGVSGAGHIAVTAMSQAATLSISIECGGRAQTVSSFMPAGQPIEGLVITPGHNAADTHTHIVLTVPRKAQAQNHITTPNPHSAEMAS